MDSNIVIVSKKVLGLTRRVTVKAVDSFTQIGDIALSNGSRLLLKARVLVADTIAVVTSSSKSR